MALLRFNAFIVLLLFYSVLGNETPEDSANQNRKRHSQDNISHFKPNNWNMDTIGQRLVQLEMVLREKSDEIRSELRQTNRRLQVLEKQNGDTHSALQAFKAELPRFSQQQRQNLQTSYIPIQRDNCKLESRIDAATKGVKIMIASMRGLNADISQIRSNINSLTNKTEYIFKSNAELSSLPKSCRELNQNQSGIHEIQPQHSMKPIMVFCDMSTMNGGWAVIQTRLNGLQDFYQSWQDYKHGFGNLGGEFWLGLENLNALTGHELNELLIELEESDSEKAYAYYGAFSVGSEVEGFPLKVLAGYKGDAGDSLIYHAGSRFSTKDMDQDSWPEGSCAQAHGGGWWYRNCDTSNLNGRYLSGQLPEQFIYQGIYWGGFKGPQHSLLKARMLIRPRDETSPPASVDSNNLQ